ncbi:MrcB family domain-containing protein [Staphylococcus chromogenes]|uniref:MrcB family domain-containing protein n=1 Tax=Staphylococcus chromogenes TaxID=46126 RepID=UPI000D032F54|nr:DUF3578 domain-containing protein [Staphylococcus chromogenes]
MISILHSILECKKKIWDEKLKMKDDLDLKERYHNLVNNELPNFIKDSYNLNEFKVWGSIGMGQYSEVPWVAISDKNITSTTQEGYYVVLLFHPEGEGVFLTLNQGWSKIKESARYYTDYSSKELAISLAKRLSQKLNTPLDQGVFHYYNDKPNNILGSNAEGYALGCIYYKYFSGDELDSESIKEYLGYFIDLYEELTKNVSRDYYFEMLKTIEDYTLEVDLEGINNKSIDIVNAPTFIHKKKSKTTTKKINNKDLKKALNEQGLTGKKGEDLAINYFKDLINNSHLTNEKKQEFNNIIRHVSKERHGDGYDLVAFNPFNLEEIEEKLVEVKATKSSSINEPFYLTLNEIWAIKENPGKVLIMRLYNITKTPKAYFIDPYKEKESFKSIEEILETLFEVEPVSFKVLGVK